MHHLLALAVLSTLASQGLAGPIDINTNGILLSREALAEIPAYNISKRFDPKHHDEIGIGARDLLDHLNENYAHHNFVREASAPGNKTIRSYHIPNDLMDLAIRSFPLHKRHDNIVKKRELKKRSEPAPFGPLERHGLAKRSGGGDGSTSFIIKRVCGGGQRMKNEDFNAAVGIVCSQHNDYLRDFFASGAAEPPAYISFGPVALIDEQQIGDVTFSFGRDDSFPWVSVGYSCRRLTRLNNCAGEGITNGGSVITTSKNGYGSFYYAIIPGDVITGQPFNTG
ncbi:hypothetical protein TWF718_001567 [Orbilia javanica]|uniref:Uncharacterized protein n=1 Tax=Orbilia javanica TaxID=47235 RepID=A0AAN8N0Z1_9PEZI